MRKKVDIDSTKAFELHEKIKANELKRRALLSENMFAITEMFESQGYKAILGTDPPPKWTGYLAQLEVFYSRSEVENYRKIFSFMKSVGVETYDYSDIPTSRLLDIVKVANQKNIGELIEKGRYIATSLEWRDEIAELQGKPNHFDCKHNYKLFRICKQCGDRHEQDAGKHESDNKAV